MIETNTAAEQYAIFLFSSQNKLDVVRDIEREPKLRLHIVTPSVKAKIYSLHDDDDLRNLVTVIPQILFL